MTQREVMLVHPTRRSDCFRVLCIDGGGMRGVYSAAYLAALAANAAARRKTADLDLGRAFDLLVGTSTGGIIACALAAGLPLTKVVDLYQTHGKEIFAVKMPNGLGFDFVRQLFRRPKYLASGDAALERILHAHFGDLTLREVYERRQVAVAIPAVEMSRHRSWVFKTSHLGGHRDDGFRLVDVCLATTAAPLYRSMARLTTPMMPGNHHVFVDGGLWANNPVLVGMIDALRMTKKGDRVEIFSLGTCPRPAGDVLAAHEMHRGFLQWKFGAEAAAVALDAQAFAYENMATMLAEHVDRDCRVVRFPHGNLPAAAMRYLSLDETSDRGLEVLIQQANDDVSLTLSVCDRAADAAGRMLAALLQQFPTANYPREPVDLDTRFTNVDASGTRRTRP